MPVADFFAYWLHRVMHCVPLLWRWTHQLHHSAERMDLSGMYLHPLDAVFTFGPTILVTVLLGLEPDAAAIAGFMTFIAAVVQHSNVRTPTWLAISSRGRSSTGSTHARRARTTGELPDLGHRLPHVSQPGEGRVPGAYGRDGALGAVRRRCSSAATRGRMS